MNPTKIKPNLSSQEISGFQYIVKLNQYEFRFRELKPLDFYDIALDEENIDLSSMERELRNLERVLVESTTPIDQLSIKEFRVLQHWVVTKIYNEKLMHLSDWLKIAFNLMKQRWSQDLEYLESLPMPKVLAFVTVQADFYRDQSKPSV